MERIDMTYKIIIFLFDDQKDLTLL